MAHVVINNHYNSWKYKPALPDGQGPDLWFRTSTEGAGSIWMGVNPMHLQTPSGKEHEGVKPGYVYNALWHTAQVNFHIYDNVRLDVNPDVFDGAIQSTCGGPNTARITPKNTGTPPSGFQGFSATCSWSSNDPDATVTFNINYDPNQTTPAKEATCTA